MNLPFSPTFFRKMDIFQQLMEYESQKDKKHLWEGEKAVLIWSGSDQHQHLGTAIDHNHVTNALAYCVEQGYITTAEEERLKGQGTQILQSLAVHEYGKPESNPAQRHDLKINKEGILAGQILTETNNLKDVMRYKKWSWDWWFLYYGAGILLGLAILNAFVQLIKAVTKW